MDNEELMNGNESYKEALPTEIVADTVSDREEKINTEIPGLPAQKVKNKKKHQRTGVAGKIVAACAIGFAFGIFAAGGFYGTKQLIGNSMEPDISTSQVETLQKQIDDLNGRLKSLGVNSYTSTDLSTASVTTDVTSVVDKVMPSMVCVTNTAEQKYYFWGRTYTQETPSSGSGIIIGESDSEYLIATNHHVIEDSKTITVQFADGAVVDAYIKGYDESIDVAVIAVKKDSMEAATRNAVAVAELGDSDALKIGEPAIAIGNALGYGQSVTTGVISALNRQIDIENSVSDLIQTSAAINPGNSGGALLNIYGEVIGINSSKIMSQSVEGVGFAIPISEVKDIIVDFSNREVRSKVEESKRGYIGITCKDSSELNLSLLGYPEGVYVENVYENSPAEKANIYPGDLIVKVDGQRISSYTELQERLSYFAEGETVTVTVTRRVNGKFVEEDIDVLLGSKDSIKE